MKLSSNTKFVSLVFLCFQFRNEVIMISESEDCELTNVNWSYFSQSCFTVISEEKRGCLSDIFHKMSGISNASVNNSFTELSISLINLDLEYIEFSASSMFSNFSISLHIFCNLRLYLLYSSAVYSNSSITNWSSFESRLKIDW